MRIEFEDDDLRRLYEEPEFRLPSLGSDLVQAFRRKVHLISRVASEQDLRSYASLHFEKLAGASEKELLLHVRRGNNAFFIVIN